MAVRRCVEFVVLAAAGALGVETFLLQGLAAPAAVEGVSMTPTLQPGQRVWINRMLCGVAPRRASVIVFRCPHDASQLCIKRVLGLPGEQVELSPSGPRIEGRPVDWPFPLAPRPGDTIRVDLADDELFVVGDNARESRDSRNGAPAGVPLRLVVGVAIGVR